MRTDRERRNEALRVHGYSEGFALCGEVMNSARPVRIAQSWDQVTCSRCLARKGLPGIARRKVVTPGPNVEAAYNAKEDAWNLS